MTLKHVNLSNNGLVTMPDEFGSGQLIESLDLRYGALSFLMFFFGFCSCRVPTRDPF